MRKGRRLACQRRSFSSSGGNDFGKSWRGLGVYRCRSLLALEAIVVEMSFALAMVDRPAGTRIRLAGKTGVHL